MIKIDYEYTRLIRMSMKRMKSLLYDLFVFICLFRKIKLLLCYVRN